VRIPCYRAEKKGGGLFRSFLKEGSENRRRKRNGKVPSLAAGGGKLGELLARSLVLFPERGKKQIRAGGFCSHEKREKPSIFPGKARWAWKAHLAGSIPLGRRSWALQVGFLRHSVEFHLRENVRRRREPLGKERRAYPNEEGEWLS